MPLPKDVVVCSYRLGGRDGVSIESAKWIWALTELGCSVRTVAGSGSADVIISGLAAEGTEPVSRTDLDRVFDGAQLVIVENLCSLPLNPEAGLAVAAALAGRPALLHHHDLASQRSHLAHFGPPPDDPRWLHVCINDLSRRELEQLGYRVEICYNRFQAEPKLEDRDAARAALGLSEGELLALQPTRAIPRKNVAGGLELARALGAIYWLSGEAEDGYDSSLRELLSETHVRVLRTPIVPAGLAKAYAACDLVVLPSTWEGFGNPALESATHRRPLAIGRYPVAAELRQFGFSWFDSDDPEALRQYLARPDDGLLAHNAEVARRHFNLADLPADLEHLLKGMIAPDTL